MDFETLCELSVGELLKAMADLNAGTVRFAAQDAAGQTQAAFVFLRDDPATNDAVIAAIDGLTDADEADEGAAQGTSQ